MLKRTSLILCVCLCLVIVCAAPALAATVYDYNDFGIDFEKYFIMTSFLAICFRILSVREGAPP